jgi:regulator of sigma E protease
LFYIVEGIIRRPVSEAVQAVGMKVGLVLVVSMMMLAIYYDVLRLVK